MATRPPPPASVLFTPMEFRVYQRWRSRYICEDWSEDFTPVPNAFKYASYQEWRESERLRCLPRNFTAASDAPHEEAAPDDSKLDELAPHGFVLAEKCKHPLYPDTGVPPFPPRSWIEEGEVPGIASHCPVCTLQLHQNLIAALSDKWKRLGGPWRTSDLVENDERMKYSDTNRAYHKAKLDLINAIHTYEDAANIDRAWEAANPDKDTTVLKSYDAAKALELYTSSITYPAHLADPKSIPLTTPGPNRSRTKSLTYSPDTPENTKHRPQAFWARGYTSHDPDSPHACPSDEGYWDTSYFNDWHFAVSQCRILLVQYAPDSDSDLVYSDLNIGPDRGLSNPHVGSLIKLLEDYIDTHDAALKQQWIAYLKVTTDYFLVFKTEGSADDVLFDSFQRVETLLGSHVEAYAREVGDIDDEEWATRREEPAEEKDEVVVEEEEEDGDESEETDSMTCETGTISDSSEAEEELSEDEDVVLADPKDLEDDGQETEDVGDRTPGRLDNVSAR